MKKYITGASGVLTFLLTVCAYAHPTDTLTIATGSKAGNYHRVGRTISDIARKHLPDIHVKVVTTLGSKENLQKIARGETDLAIVQNDMAFAAERGLDPFKHMPISGLRGVMMLYTEPIFVISNQTNQRYFGGEDSHEPISVGKPDSGTRYNARTVLMTLGMWDNDLIIFEHIGDIWGRLLDHQVQYAFANSIPGPVKHLIDADSLSVLSLRGSLIDGLTHTYSYLSPHSSPILSDSVHTIAVQSMIVARQDLPYRVIHHLTEALHEELPTLHAVFPGEQEYYAQQDLVRGMPLKKWHEGAYQYYHEQGIELTQRYSSLWRYILPLPPLLLALLGVLNLTVIGFRGHALRYFNRGSLFLATLKQTNRVFVKSKYAVVLLVVGYLMLVSTFMVMQAEREWAIESNAISIFENSSFGRNLLWMFVFAVSGFEDGLFPQSPVGKFWATLYPLVSVFGLITFIGMLTTDHIQSIMAAKGKKGVDQKDHIILCGWSKNVPFLIQNLLHNDIVTKRDLVVLADIEPATFETALEETVGRKQIKRSGKAVDFVQGCATRRHDLEKANLAEADIAVIVADDDTEERDRDARNILKILTIERYCEELECTNAEGAARRRGRKNIYTIAEIEHAENFETARDAMVDEIVSYDQIRSKLFMQSILNPGISAFFDEVLTYNAGNDIYSYQIESGSRLEKLSFDELLVLLRQHQVLLLSIIIDEKSQDVEASPLATKPKQRVLTNPKTYNVRAGDRLIVLCQDEHSLKTAIKEVNSSKTTLKGIFEDHVTAIKQVLNGPSSKYHVTDHF